MVWDATCPDTFAPSYRAHATQEPGKVAEAAEDRKCKKYMGLPPGHFFSPVAIETLGAIGPKSLALLKELGRRIRAETGEPKSREYLLQRLSVAIQRGHCTSVGEHTLEGDNFYLTNFILLLFIYLLFMKSFINCII